MSGVSIRESLLRHRNFFLGQRDDQLTTGQVDAMRRDMQRIFQVYGMEAVTFETNMTVHGTPEWRLAVGLPDDAPVEVFSMGSRLPTYREGRRGATVLIEGDGRDLEHAGSEARLFELIARALDTMLRNRMLRGETMTVSCHELLHRYQQGRRNGQDYYDRFDEVFPLHSNYSLSDGSRRELRDNWHFTGEDIAKIEREQSIKDGPTEEVMEMSYRV